MFLINYEVFFFLMKFCKCAVFAVDISCGIITIMKCCKRESAYLHVRAWACKRERVRVGENESGGESGGRGRGSVCVCMCACMRVPGNSSATTNIVRYQQWLRKFAWMTYLAGVWFEFLYGVVLRFLLFSACTVQYSTLSCPSWACHKLSA
jgi:hypothetical protein